MALELISNGEKLDEMEEDPRILHIKDSWGREAVVTKKCERKWQTEDTGCYCIVL